MTGLGSSCGACKFLRRKCAVECVFAPYFCYEEAATHFAAVHKVFGASNVSKLLLNLPLQYRSDAAITISYEALARMLDPVHGCVAQILELQQQIINLQEEIEVLENQMANRAAILQNSSVNACNYQNEVDPLLFQIEDALPNKVIDGTMEFEFGPFHGWEDQDMFAESIYSLNAMEIERLLDGAGQQNFACYPL